MSVRITAAGAVLVAISFLTAPARACDDRFVKKCETAAAVAHAEEAAAEPARRTSKRVKAAPRQAAPSRLAVRSKPPRFAVREARGYVLASAGRTPAESPLARRFRGFIDAQPIALNAFEALRKPQAAAHDFDVAAILPQAEAMAADLAANAAPAAPAAKPATIATTKQDRLASPTAPIELASAQSRQLALAALAPAAPAVLAAPAIVTEAPPERQPSPFSIHGLVLALCGALGAASALRFIVGA